MPKIMTVLSNGVILVPVLVNIMFTLLRSFLFFGKNNFQIYKVGQESLTFIVSAFFNEQITTQYKQMINGTK